MKTIIDLIENEKLFCIVPAYNEEKNLEKTILGLSKVVRNTVVVNDGSSDGTTQKLKNISKNFSGVVVLEHSINRGQGAALETGDEYARRNNAEIVVHFDADGQFDSNQIVRVVEPIIRGEADIVFGSRFLDNKSKIPFFKKFFILPVGRIVNMVLIGGSLKDSQIGFRALSSKALNLIRIENDKMAHASEIIGKSFKYKMRIKEVPVTVIYNEFGQGLGGGVKIVKDLIIDKFI